MNIAISGLGAALFSAYIVYDVQAMVGGGEYALSPDEYVMAGELGVVKDELCLQQQHTSKADTDATH
jgi:hypothetical protein